MSLPEKGEPGYSSKRVAFFTLGCKLNFSESSTVARDLLTRGFRKVDFGERADLYVINTCSVTENAERKCRKVVRQARRASPDAFIAVMGCYAQLRPQEISSIPGVDVVVGADEKFNLPARLGNLEKRSIAQSHSCDIDQVHTFFPSYSAHERTRAFLKVQDGCDYNCSYCTIPDARGKSRSGSVFAVMEQARWLAQTGVREIVLTGVNIGDFGAGSNESLLDLIQSLDKIDSIDRVRISSIEPNLLTDAIIHFVARSERFVPHFHIPLQSGSNRILSAMRRRYRADLYRKKVATIREHLPDCCIGVDVIVGFPGETEADFLETYELLLEADISYLHVFTYSERPDTKALEISPIVSKEDRAGRSRILHTLSRQKRESFYERHCGRTMPILFEEYHNGILSGMTENYIRVKTAGERRMINEIENVHVLEQRRDYLMGELTN